MGERTRYEHGTFCWAGLATSDTVAAKDFYARLFGWEAEDLWAGEAGTYTALRIDGNYVAVLYSQTDEARSAGTPPHWTPFISVDDADAIAARARQLGGALLREPFDVVDAGRVAAVQDPLGAIVSLWQPRSPDGAALIDKPGALCWNELVTTDVERSRAFYEALLGAGRPNGGMRVDADREQGAAPMWLPYFMVEDADAAARAAERAGGRVLATTTESTIGRYAVLADPQGAQFAVLEP
jgi:predicted enzyme related to lactoylglutathione lyase